MWSSLCASILQLGFKCRSKFTGDCMSAHFEIFTPKENFWLKSPNAQNPPKLALPEIPRNPPKFPRNSPGIPRNSPKSSEILRFANDMCTSPQLRVLGEDPEPPKQQQVGARNFFKVPKIRWPPRPGRKFRKWTLGRHVCQILQKPPVLDTRVPNSMGLIDFLPNL